MTIYCVHLEELQKLAKGEIKVEDIAKPENIALLSWSGEDIKMLLEGKAQATLEEIMKRGNWKDGFGTMDFEAVVNSIVDRLENTGCGDCVNFIVNDFIKDGEC